MVVDVRVVQEDPASGDAPPASAAGVTRDAGGLEAPATACASYDHPYARDVVIPDKLQLTRVGSCLCGARVYPAGGEPTQRRAWGRAVARRCRYCAHSHPYGPCPRCAYCRGSR